MTKVACRKRINKPIQRRMSIRQPARNRRNWVITTFSNKSIKQPSMKWKDKSLRTSQRFCQYRSINKAMVSKSSLRGPKKALNLNNKAVEEMRMLIMLIFTRVKVNWANKAMARLSNYQGSTKKASSWRSRSLQTQWRSCMWAQRYNRLITMINRKSCRRLKDWLRRSNRDKKVDKSI